MKSKHTEMPSQRFKRSLLAVSIVALSAPVLAQNNNNSESTMEEVVVVGMRNSIDNAQDLKRNADTVKDVITASDIGALPDKSVTEALQRVPGVTIERFASSSDPKHYADEGTGVLVRGLDRVRSEVNGRDAFSANPWGGLSYEDFPAELLGAVEVVKNQTADLISGGIAGTVNLITRKPFDSDEQLLAIGAKANYGDFREEVTPSFSALFSDNWETSAGKFGFLLAGSRSDLETRGDGVGVGNFHSRGLDTTPPGSWEMWGELIAAQPGKVAGKWDSPCTPNAWTWDASCTGPTANLIKPEEAHVSPYDGPALEGQPTTETWYAPAQYHMSTAENDRIRKGFTTSLQWANTDETVIATVEHINSEASLEWRERQIGQAAQGFKPFMGRSHNWVGDAENGRPLVIENGFVVAGIGLGVEPETPLNYRTRWNYTENTVEDTSFNLTLTPTDHLKLEFDIQHVDSEKIVHNYSMAGQTRGSVAQYVMPFYMDLRGDRPTFEFLDEGIMTPAIEGTEPNVFLGTGMEQEEFNTATLDSFKLDLEYSMDGVFTAMKTGVYFSDKDLTIRDTNYAGWSAIGTPWLEDDRVPAAAVNIPHMFEQVDFSDYYHGKVIKGNVNSFYFPKMDAVKEYAYSLRRGCEDGVGEEWSGVGEPPTVVDGETTSNGGNAADKSGGCAKPYADMAARDGQPFADHDISESNEKRAEFYVRGDFAFDDIAIPIKGNIGLRYVGYELESTGYLVLPDEASRGSESGSAILERDYKAMYDLAGGNATQSTVKGTDYDTVLPSLNLSFGVHDDVVVRLGVSKGLYYPSLDRTRNTMVLSMEYESRLQDPSAEEDPDTNPVVGIDSVSLSASANNPYLEPEEAVNFDVTTEWYFATAGSVTLGLFHKELDNIIRNRQFNVDVEYNGISYPVSAYGPANTGSGTIRGAEFSYSQFYDFLPGAWSGLGLQFNYTYIDQNGLEDPNGAISPSLTFNSAGEQVTDERNTFRIFSGLPLEGYSDENMNIVGMYEFNDISFRLAYTWRSEYLLTLRESEDFVPVYAESTGMMDASLYYSISDNWKVGIEGSNLLNTETKTQYQMNQAGVRTDALSFTTDRRYALSVRATF